MTGPAESGFVHGVRIGVDVGSVRIGVAVCDPVGILATPLATVLRDNTNSDDLPTDMVEIGRLVRAYEAVGVVIGLPVNLAGQEGRAAIVTRQYAEILKTVVDPVPVLMVDERMSTVTATRRLSERGVRGKRQRAVVDQAAAVEILQSWLEAQRRRT
jgi:putative Holliday junction resolvase